VDAREDEASGLIIDHFLCVGRARLMAGPRRKKMPSHMETSSHGAHRFTRGLRAHSTPLRVSRWSLRPLWPTIPCGEKPDFSLDGRAAVDMIYEEQKRAVMRGSRRWRHAPSQPPDRISGRRWFRRAGRNWDLGLGIADWRLEIRGRCAECQRNPICFRRRCTTEARRTRGWM